MTGHLDGLAVLATDTRPEDSQVSPGLIGFLATFAVAVVVVLLLLDLVRRLRRLKYREELENQRTAEDPLPEGAAAVEPGPLDRGPVEPGPVVPGPVEGGPVPGRGGPDDDPRVG